MQRITYGNFLFEFLLSDGYVNVVLLVVCCGNKIATINLSYMVSLLNLFFWILPFLFVVP